MPISMPDEGTVPAGPRRNLVNALHELYTNAGRPSTREMEKAIGADSTLRATVSRETLGRRPSTECQGAQRKFDRFAPTTRCGPATPGHPPAPAVILRRPAWVAVR